MKFGNKQWSEKALQRWLSETSTSNIVNDLDNADKEQQVKVFNLLPPSRVEVIFNDLEPVSQSEIIQGIESKKALALLEKMEPDDRARLFEELPKERKETFLRRLSTKERRATSMLLNYPLESAGRIMSPFFIALQPEMSVEEALEKVRDLGEEAETIYSLPVVDETMQLKGVVELKKLVMAKSSHSIAELIPEESKSFSVYTDQEEVARFIQTTDLLAVPIVEENNRLVGIVTIDDAMDIMQIEETEDIIRGSASEPLRKPYFSVSVFRLMKIRIIWLFILALAGAVTVNVLNVFESTLSQDIALVLFIPLLMGIGGNSASQSATTIVRALAMNQVHNHDFVRVAAREVSVGILLGSLLGITGYFIIFLLFEHNIALIVALSVFVICSMATLAGSLMPILARFLKLDPAVVSAPLVATVIDAAGLLVYFMIAKLILQL